VIFNGNGYCADNQALLTKHGVWCINSGVDAMKRYTAPKNVALFEKMGVLTGEECEARQAVMFNHYIGTVEVEVRLVRNVFSVAWWNRFRLLLYCRLLFRSRERRNGQIFCPY
jgi:glutamine synthetase type III